MFVKKIQMFAYIFGTCSFRMNMVLIWTYEVRIFQNKDEFVSDTYLRSIRINYFNFKRYCIGYM